ncbi:hypothetical protein F5879DRAFT_961847 [Lentinula edodes]|nr:hypothetical protein F5879DRAFT_961847 [Lentinula edodes]
MFLPKPGVYRLVNLQSNTALDLSEGDGKSFIGWTKHDNPNQQFVFTPLGHGGGYLIQSAWNGNYATIEDGICTGTAVVGSGFPVTWALEDVTPEMHETHAPRSNGACFRIRWPNSRYVFDLEGYGCDKDGTRIQLAYEKNPVHPCQVWRFEEISYTVPLTSGVNVDAATPLAKFDPGLEVPSGRLVDDLEDESDEDSDYGEFQDASEDGLELELISAVTPINSTPTNKEDKEVEKYKIRRFFDYPDEEEKGSLRQSHMTGIMTTSSTVMTTIAYKNMYSTKPAH